MTYNDLMARGARSAAGGEIRSAAWLNAAVPSLDPGPSPAFVRTEPGMSPNGHERPSPRG
jgi:hypothetical protein